MTGKLNAALACATTLRLLNDGSTIREATNHMAILPDCDINRPMTGFFNTLSSEQKAAALDYDGPENHYYDPENPEQVREFWENSILMYPDSQLKEQVRDFKDTPSVFDVLAKAFGLKRV